MNLFPFRVKVIQCARCGNDHDAVSVVPFMNPPEGYEFTHWGNCPSSGDPILFIVLESPAELPPPTDTPTP